MRSFSNFACVDWSGAKTERPKGIAVATIGRDRPLQLIQPYPRWSRLDIRDWLLRLADAKEDILIGFDLSASFPFVDQNSYFPGWRDSPPNAKSLWKMVDDICSDDPHLAVSSFLNHSEVSRYFRHSREYVGDLFSGGVGRLRAVERYQRETKQGNSASCFNLVGAAQVSKSGLTGMRMLHQLNGVIPVWPFDPIPAKGPLIIEIYTTIASLAAGMPKGRSKIRDRETLNKALGAFEVPPPAPLRSYDDHSTDALLTAAWIRTVAQDEQLWNSRAMTSNIAQKEGWTFGVV